MRYNAELDQDSLQQVVPTEISPPGMRGCVMNCYTSDQNSVASQCWIEHKVLTHIKDALRVTLDWKVPSVGVLRKLTSVRFTLRSFQRHLERIMSLEEDGGYMIVVEELKPNMSEQADALRSEHDEFRASLERLVPSLDQLSQEDERRFHQVCYEINVLLDQVDQHDSKEVTLLQDALLMDEGGEG